MIKYKKANTSVTLPIILVICVVMIMVIGIFVANTILPFIWYQKLNSVSLKYMFVIEKYGYLTAGEKENLLKDLKNQGFNTSKVTVNAPSSIKDYGELIEFELKYKLTRFIPQINNLALSNSVNELELVIYKNSYSKR